MISVPVPEKFGLDHEQFMEAIRTIQKGETKELPTPFPGLAGASKLTCVDDTANEKTFDLHWHGVLVARLRIVSTNGGDVLMKEVVLQ